MNKIKILKIAVAILGVILLVLLGGYLIFNSYYSKMNHKEQTKTTLNSEEIENINKELESEESGEDSPEEEVKSIEDQILENLKNNATELASDGDVFNILLVGTDNRENVAGSRSDSMIVVSINKKTKEITMTSFMRDSYVSIPEYGNNRLNAAFAFGGPSLLIDTIESNFKIDINRYAQVDFYAFIDIINAFGGIDMEISEDEMKVINDYTGEVNRLQGADKNSSKLTDFGLVHLDGKQALSYSRIRYVGNNDFGRTERQRKVLSALFTKAKDSGIVELKNLFDMVLPEVTTDLTQGECFSLLLNLNDYKNYEIKSNRVPYDGAWSSARIRGMSVLNLDFEKNIKQLQKDIYDIGDETESEAETN